MLYKVPPNSDGHKTQTQGFTNTGSGPQSAKDFSLSHEKCSKSPPPESRSI